MPSMIRGYLRYARGESGALSPWNVLNIFGAALRPIVRARNAMFDRGMLSSCDPKIPVISVGNLCHGGTNKTPMVEMLARTLDELGLSVGIVSRGYGGKTDGASTVDRDTDRSVAGDEPLMLASRLPGVKIVVSRDRLSGVELLASLGADVAIADDAFQHRRMGRDVDLVLIDATCPFGNGRLFPAGILREPPSSVTRADAVVLTKTDQVGPDVLDSLMIELARLGVGDRVFTARVSLDSWLVLTHGKLAPMTTDGPLAPPRGPLLAFSAIGNPESFESFLKMHGVEVAESVVFRDHHRFTWNDMDDLERAAAVAAATGFICTEKDLQNMPQDPVLHLPLYVPRISVALDDAPAFWRSMTDRLRPRIVVTSNGYGEDAIGALLADKLRARFAQAEVSAFALVGRGSEYAKRGIEVISPPSEMPSGGVVKYSLRALFKDMRHGLGSDIKKQIAAWRALRGRFRTPICVGDVYLLLVTVWGQGMSPALVATAKSVQTNGHLGIERRMMRRSARMVWTRDAATADDLVRARVPACFKGSPIMDLALDAGTGDDPWEGARAPRVLLLPGSRPRAYDDVAMLLDSVRMMASDAPLSCVMVLAPTIDADRIAASTAYERHQDFILAGRARVRLFTGPIADAAAGADILIGLGGTANQVCAGMGVPVVSIIEKGKLAQKKLLRDAELLVPATAEELAAAAQAILNDSARMRAMSEAGVKMLGGPGAVDAVCEYADHELGWGVRCRLYAALSDRWTREPQVSYNLGSDAEADDVEANDIEANDIANDIDIDDVATNEEEVRWQGISPKIAADAARLVKAARLRRLV